MSEKRYRVSADIGGTFTDLVFYDQITGVYKAGKTLTTPKNLSDAVMNGIGSEIKDFNEIDFFVHGTTSGLNAFLERRGARVALVMTKGFRDVYEIARGNRPPMFDMRYRKPTPLLKPCDSFEIEERLLTDGTEYKPVSRDSVKAVAEEIRKGEYTSIAVCLINAYENPKFTSESEKVIKAQNELNKYVSSEIYYIFDNEIEVLDSSIINTWLEVDSTMNVVINEEKIKEYIKTLGIKYDTYGKTRSFKSTTGKNINVPGGNYGWRIDRTKEKEAIIENIKSGEIIKKEPIYLQTALGNHENDIGNTYVEINLTNQYLWFYKSGKIITQGDVVTGNVSRGNATPQGTYTLNYKQKNATLRGDNYNSDVKYWMPFNMNIGIHDASWRNSFGGNIYQTSGSHGCVNAPEYLAKNIFENIEPGTPIICYKDE